MLQKNISFIIPVFLILASLFILGCDDGSTPEEGSIIVKTPNGGETWQIGTTQYVQWTSSNTTGDIKIELSVDDGITYTTMVASTVDDGMLSWNITGQVTTSAKIRVTSVDDPNISDESDNAFTLSEVVTAPSNLTTTISNSRDISLTWVDHSVNEQGFIIEQRTNIETSWAELARVDSNILGYKDSALSTNKAYFYRVRAFNANGVSGETNVASKILGWVRVQTNTTQTLNGIHFANSSVAIAVGENGTILRSASGGDEWSSVSSGTTSSLYSVSFVNASTGLAVGSKGTILRTTDGGMSWTNRVIGGAGHVFKGVDFANINDAYAVGYYYSIQFPDSTWGVIYRSTDGGVSWSSISEQWRYTFEDVGFPIQNNGVVVGSIASHELIFRTTNRGQFWSKLSDESLYPLLGIQFLDANTGTAVGKQGMIMRTGNGGASWTDVSYGTFRTLYKSAYIDATHEIAVGEQGLYLRTIDGGANWVSVSTGSNENFYDIFINDANTQTIVGANGLVLRTSNGGVQ